MERLPDITDLMFGIFISSWELFTEAAPYLFLGFGVAGLLHSFVPDEKIIQYLGRSAGRFRSVVNASLVGVPLPLCSCGVIPAALSLRGRGASKGSTLSFLISTPETGIDSISITYALLDPIMTIFRPLASFVTAVVAGIAENTFGEMNTGKRVLSTGQMTIPLLDPCERSSAHADGKVSVLQDVCNGSCCCDDHSVPENCSLASRILAGLKYAYLELVGDIALWLIIGILLAGIISYSIPEDLLSGYVGGGLISMLISLLFGIPLYICATASTPLAAAFIAKGMSPGAAFVFLLAGPATNAATITMVIRFMGKRTAAIYLLSISICAVAGGLLLDQVYLLLGTDPLSIVSGSSGIVPQEAKTISGILLLPLLLHGIYLRKIKAKFKKRSRY